LDEHGSIRGHDQIQAEYRVMYGADAQRRTVRAGRQATCNPVTVASARRLQRQPDVMPQAAVDARDLRAALNEDRREALRRPRLVVRAEKADGDALDESEVRGVERDVTRFDDARERPRTAERAQRSGRSLAEAVLEDLRVQCKTLVAVTRRSKIGAASDAGARVRMEGRRRRMNLPSSWPAGAAHCKNTHASTPVLHHDLVLLLAMCAREDHPTGIPTVLRA
jgi:hypothetical protein